MQPFEIDQLKVYFADAFFARLATSDVPYAAADPSWRFWLPLVCLFNGFRPNEVCQLHVADIQCTKAGTWFFDLCAGAGKSFKTEATYRRAPIHPELLRLGFVDFAANARTAGQVRLFER